MEDAEYFRHKAEQCRRLATSIVNQNDPAIARLMALAVEFEAKAVALAAEEASAAQIDQLPPAADSGGQQSERERCTSH